MKKASILLFLLFVGITYSGFSQGTSVDFFAGKWEIDVTGTPRGDVTFVTDLVRKDGKLTGELIDQADPANGKRKITKVEENGNNLAIYFESSQAGEISIDLAKAGTDNLEGTLMSYPAKAKRLK